jgi:ACS family hexuronate transporter-like MFS transporter
LAAYHPEPNRADSDGPSTLSPLAVALISLLVSSAVLNYVDRLTTSALAPTLKAEFSLTDTEWGWVNSAFALAYIFSSLVGGRWIDRIGVRKGLLVSSLIWSLAAAGHAFAKGFWSLCFWRMLLALGEGPGIPCMLKGMRRLMPPRLRDMGTGLIFAGGAAGALIAPLGVIPIATRYGWQAGFLTTGSFGLLWMPLWYLLAFRRSVNLGPEAVQLKAGSDRPTQPIQWRSLALWATLLAVFFTVAPTVYANSFLSVHLNKTFHLSQEAVGRVMWQPFLAVDIGQLFGGFAAMYLLKLGWTYLSARRLVMCFGFIGAAVVLGMNYQTDVQAALHWLNISRFCYQAAYTVLMAYGIESVAEGQTASMAGLMNATFSACNFVFSPIIGKLSDCYGYNAVIILIAVTPLVGLACWLVLSRLQPTQAPPQQPVSTAKTGDVQNIRAR